jgi:hypothetical protein
MLKKYAARTIPCQGFGWVWNLALGPALALGIGQLATSISGRASPADKAEVHLSRVARITQELSGSYNFFRVAAAPDDAHGVMVCTLHLSPATNEGSAEVFGSWDGGETWTLRLKDQSSRDVSEDACAFGEVGRAYFIAQPWNVRDPYLLHASVEDSELRLYRSSSYGADWPAFLTSSFVDYARIVVDSQAESPFRGRAYIVGNQTAEEKFPLFTVLDGGRQLKKARQNDSLKRLTGKHGQYPRSAIVLQNGDVLASYEFTSPDLPRNPPSAVLIASRDGGQTVDGPFTIEKHSCPGLGMGSPSIAEDPRSRSVFAFYSVESGSACSPTVARSDDHGGTWKHLAISLQDIVESSDNGAVWPCSISFLKDGVALLTWTANFTVYGALFDQLWQPLWSGEISRRSFASKVNVVPYVRGDTRFIDSSSVATSADMNISLQFETPLGGEVDAVVRSDDVFLVVWRQNDGQLYSRSIRIGLPPPPGAVGLVAERDVTDSVRYEAENLTVDENTNILEYEMSLVNISDLTLRGPLLLRIRTVESTIGSVALQNVIDNEIVFGSGGPTKLLSGEHTSPATLRIQVSPEAFKKMNSKGTQFPRISIIGRVYAGSSELR